MKQKHFVADQLPNYVKADHPTFVEFVKAYYEWFEEQYSLDKFQNLVDIDRTVDAFLVYFKKQYDVFNILQGIDNRFYLKHIKELYSAKGSSEAIKYLFKIKYEQEADVLSPWDDVLKVSDGKWYQETGTIVKITYGNIQTIIGDFVYLVDTTGLKFKTSVKNATQRVGDVYELAINRFSCGPRRFLRVESIDGTFVADILLTVASAEIEKGRGGRNFRVGQVFSVRGLDGSESLIKVKSVSTPDYPLSNQQIYYDYDVVDATWTNGVASIEINSITHKIKTGQKISISGIPDYNGTFIVTGVSGAVIRIGQLNGIDQISEPDTNYVSGGLIRYIDFQTQSLVSNQGAITSVEVFGFGYGFQKDFNIIVAPFDEKPEIGPNIQIITTDISQNQGSYTFETDDNISARLETGSIVRHNYTNVLGNVAAQEIIPGGEYLISSPGTTKFKEIAEKSYLQFEIITNSCSGGVVTLTLPGTNHGIEPGERVILLDGMIIDPSEGYPSFMPLFFNSWFVTAVNGTQIIIDTNNPLNEVRLNEDWDAAYIPGILAVIKSTLTVNDTFVAKSLGDGTGTALQLYSPPTSCTNLINNIHYTIETPGSTDFTLIGGPKTIPKHTAIVSWPTGVNLETNEFTTINSIPHQFTTGDIVVVYETDRQSSGNPPVNTYTHYFIIVVSPTKFKLAPTYQDALDGTHIQIVGEEFVHFREFRIVFVKQLFEDSLPITGVTIIDGGINYNPDTVSITFDEPAFPNGVRATGTVTVTNGSITGVTITNQGSGYLAYQLLSADNVQDDDGYGFYGSAISSKSNSSALIITRHNRAIDDSGTILYPGNDLKTGDAVQYVRYSNPYDGSDDPNQIKTPLDGLQYNQIYYVRKVLEIFNNEINPEDAFYLHETYEDAILGKNTILQGPVPMERYYPDPENPYEYIYVDADPITFDYIIPLNPIRNSIYRTQFPNLNNSPIPINPLSGSGIIKYPMFNGIDQLSASNMIAGNVYKILSIGTTNFINAGAGQNVIGQYFISTGPLTGTGTVESMSQITYAYDLTYVGEVAGKIIERVGFRETDSDFATIRCRVGCTYQYPGFYLKSDSIVGDTAYIQDSDFYQVYSYQVVVEEVFNQYGDILKKTLHPAGTKLFGNFAITNEFQFTADALSEVNLIAKRDEIIDFVEFTELIEKIITKSVPISIQSSNVSSNTVTLDNHGFNTGDSFIYHSVTGSSISNFVNGKVYYAIKVGDNQFKITDSYEKALNNQSGSIGTITGTVKLYKDYAKISDSISLRSENMKLTANNDIADANDVMNFLTWKGNIKILLAEVDKYEGDTHSATVGSYGGAYWEPHYVELLPPYWLAGYLNTEREFQN